MELVRIEEFLRIKIGKHVGSLYHECECIDRLAELHCKYIYQELYPLIEHGKKGQILNLNSFIKLFD